MSISRALPALAALFLCAACGDGAGIQNGAPINIVVTPSLGRIQNGVIEILRLDGSLITSAGTGGVGAASFQLPAGFSGPILIRVCGSDSGSYFDEGLGAEAPLTATQCLRAIVPDLTRREIGVTGLTEAAARYLEANGGLLAATPTSIASAAELVRRKLAPELETLFEAPWLVGAVTDLNALPATSAGLYAFKLAMLARAAAAQSLSRGGLPGTPAYNMAVVLGDDLGDGVLDGQSDGKFIVSRVYDIHHIVSLLEQQVQDAATQSTALNALVTLLDGAGLLADVQVPVPGNSLLSWQGVYSGTWILGDGVDIAKANSSFFPVDYQGFLDQLTEGGPCMVTVSDGAVAVSSLAFVFDYMTTLVADAEGARRYQMSRMDSTSYLALSSSAMLSTHNQQVRSVVFNGLGTFSFLQMNATATCVIAQT